MNTVLTTTHLRDLDFKTFQAKMRPELEQFLEENQDALKGNQVDMDKALQDMYALVHGNFPIYWSSATSPRAYLPALVGDTSACVMAIATVAIDCVAIVLQAAGVPGSVTRAVAQDVVEDISPEALNGLERMVQALEQADTIQDKAMAIFKLFGAIYKITGIRQILGAIEHHLAWYQWLIMGTVISAQITAWVASDGVAAVAEIAILGAFVGQAVADSALAVQNCSTN